MGGTLRRTRERFALSAESAADALRGDPARSLATAAAIASGVAVIVALVSVSAGGRREVLRAVEAAGPANVFVRAAGSRAAGTPPLTTREIARARARFPELRAAAALRTGLAPARVGRRREPVPVYAVDEGVAAVFPMRAAQGRLLAPLDRAGRSRCALLGSEVARRLGAEGAAVGRRLVLGTGTFDVVGVLAPVAADPGTAGTKAGPDWNRAMIVPLGSEPGAALAPEGDYPVDLVVLKFGSPAEAARSAWLLEKLQATNGEWLSVTTPLQALAQYRAARRSFDRVVALVSLLTTLAAGFGISNFLWAAVRARGAEIGLRRAVGAFADDIRAQFLVEALYLGTAGGLIGVGVGIALSRLLLVHAGWKPAFEPGSLALMVVGAGACGLLAGLRPAAEAARIEPAAALRIE